MERDANAIARDTRRGKGNIMICSADVASAMTMAGLLDYQSALQDNLNVDSTGNTFAGVLNGRLKVYIDPYMNMALPYPYRYKCSVCYWRNIHLSTMLLAIRAHHHMTLVLFYCPYVPLQMVRAVGENSFQPKIGFQDSIWNAVVNPFAEAYTNPTTRCNRSPGTAQSKCVLPSS